MANETLVNATNQPTFVQEAVNATVNPVDTAAEHLHGLLRDGLTAAHQPWLDAILGQPLVFALATAAAGFLVAYLLVYLSQTIIKAFTSRTKTDLDDILLERLRHPVALSIFLFFLSVALVPLSLTSVLADVTNKLILSLNVFLVAVIVNRVLSILIMHYGGKIAARTESTVDDHLLPIVRKIVAAVVYVIAVLVILGVWGVNIGPLLAGAGIAGIAIAFAMQESLRNIFGGVTLAFDRAYAVGDRIKLVDGTVGTVLDITLRSTKIRTFDGDLIVVPNGKIANENFQTYAQPTHQTRVVVPFSVAYGNDPAAIRELIVKALKGKVTHQIELPAQEMTTTVQFIEMGAYSLNFRAILWVDDYVYSWDAKLQANELVYAALRKAKVEIPYPRQVVELKRAH